MKTPPAAVTGAPNPRLIAYTASEVAREHRTWIAQATPARSLIELLHGSGEGLTGAYDTLARAASRGQPLTPGGHWFLDNFYVVRDARTTILKEIRSRFYRKLPRLGRGPMAGYPRIFAVAEIMVDLVDNGVDTGTLIAFLSAYQDESPLSIAELWALPTMLRIALVRRLHALAGKVREAHLERLQATDWAERIGEAALEDPADALLLARTLVEERSDVPEGLILKVIEALPSAGLGTGLAAEWFERALSRKGGSVQEVVRRDTQRQISVGNAFTALRWASNARWGRIVEAASRLERTLRRDPTGLYTRMDFSTRDRYRHVIEEIAKHSPLTEVEIAERLLELSAPEPPDEGAPPSGPPGEEAPLEMGHYLIGPGVRAFERAVSYRPPLRVRVRRLAGRATHPLYFGAIALITGGTTWATFAYAAARGAAPEALTLLAVSAILPLLDLAIAFTNRLVAWLVPPRRLPKMDAERGVDERHRTLVVVPTLIRDAQDAVAQVEHLEIHYRANPSPLLRFALLTDFGDADSESVPGDDETVAAARAAVDALNERERDEWGDRFFLLHRSRRWNPGENVWMGWERKRGKLEELNTILRDPGAETSYDVVVGDFASVTADDAIRYVITLDADTQLPPGAALDLIRTAAHPLNQPRFDPEKERVTRGYGILQPRVAISPRGTFRSAFARIFSGNVGLDPYTTAVSDVYQDLFHDGIFTGKGLYHVDAFRAALADAVPADTVLSHDLLEGSFARAALVTDVEVFDDYPSTYLTYAKRMHRWVRGDWQISPWLLPTVRRRSGKRHRNPLTFLGRWRIFDNMRRSLTPAAMAAFLLVGWVIPLVDPLLWTGLALAVLAFPVYVNLTTAIFKRPEHATWLSYFDGVAEDLGTAVVQTGLTIVFLPHLAYSGVDATVRALWRMTVSRRHLLEWTTASDAEARNPNTLGAYTRFMWVSIAWAVAAGALVTWLAPFAWIAAGPFLVAWAAAPWISWRLSRRAGRAPEVLTREDAAWLREVAHRTWTFFDRFMGPETSWLPPDNVQEAPFRGVAARTSPTNIGLALLSAQAAYDFGWSGREALLTRLSNAAASVDNLERYEGHLLNWYSTVDGATLWPRYVSTVDSGNFVAALVALGAGMAELPHGPLWRTVDARGVRDEVRLIRKLMARRTAPSVPPAAVAALDELEESAEQARSDDPLAWVEALDVLAERTDALSRSLDITGPVARDRNGALDPLGDAVTRLVTRIATASTDVHALLPWLSEGSVPPETAVSAPSLAGFIEGLGRQPEDALVERAIQAAERHVERAAALSEWCRTWVEGTRFGALYDRAADLFTIGFNVDTLESDSGHYDLLASEARLASFLAVAKGDVPVDHWFRLGRTAGVADGTTVLLSWAGTMFEYLMPLLLTGSWQGTLLSETCEEAVDVQMRYGARAGLPWGISESAYNTLNLDLDYQYRAFGVPGLGLKRGLSEDFVVAPYATALAAMVRPASAVGNLRRLAGEGAFGHYGFYDAVDYTPDRIPPGQTRSLVATWMAHHQAMTLLALSNVLDHGRLQHRFQSAALARSAELLLQERVPRRIETTDPHPMETSVDPGGRETAEPPVAHVPPERLHDPTVRGQFLSNGRYTTFITQAGTGFARFKDWELTRWQADRTTDPLGLFFYLRDVESGERWSITHLPTRPPHDRLDTWHHLSKVESALVHDWIESYVEIGVSPEDDLEVRRLTITNYGDRSRRLDLTSYLEVVLNKVGADRAHPAFSKLFVETEALPDRRALLASRRPRKEGETSPWMFHSLVVHPGRAKEPALEFETDRARFIGRGRTLANPAAVQPGVRLSGSAGPVLDPIFSLRRPLELGPRDKVVVSFTLGAAPDRAEALRLIERYDSPSAIQRALELATAYGPAELQHLNIRELEALRYQEVGAAILQGDPRLRAGSDILAANTRQQSALWAYGISGDLPIVILKVESLDQVDRVEEMMRAAHFWRLRGLRLDVVFLNEHPPSYAEGLQDRITATIESGVHRLPGEEARGANYVLRADQLPPQDRILLLTVAHAVFEGRIPGGMPLPQDDVVMNEGPVPTHAPTADVSQIDLPEEDGVVAIGDAPSEEAGSDTPGEEAVSDTPGEEAGSATVRLPARPYPLSQATPHDPSLDEPIDGGAPQRTATRSVGSFDNGYGHFTDDGRYEITTDVDSEGMHPPPLPWINVVANPDFGFTATSEGGGYTWSLNSRENRLTPWSNDPVVDRPGEATWVRDDDEGRYASVTPNPTPAPGSYRTVHGFGHTEYHARFGDLDIETTLFVANDAPVKFARVRIRNAAESTRHLSLFRYQEWVMGVYRSDSSRYVVTARDEETEALVARNTYNQEFADRYAFTHVVSEGGDWECTADRSDFLGHTRDVFRPRAVEEDARLDEVVGANLDPCSAYRVPLALEPGTERVVTFLLGECATLPEARDVIRRYPDQAAVDAELDAVIASWGRRLGRVRVRTPDPAWNRILDGWLLYQALACRMWARSAFYQSGGAYGFRDQLQDSMAMVYVDPKLTRDQILLHAAHQFQEGDVLHWWHPPTGRGIRSRFTDDLLWLPYVTTFYIGATGDADILEERVGYLTARLLEEGEDEAYLVPTPAALDGDIYDHCCRTLDRSLTAGRHGIPLMGSGDWNDGMNRVGTGGEGESVWLGFFLHTVLEGFIPFCEARGDDERASRYRAYMGTLAGALNADGWDGQWYRRAFYDDGTPLGSAENVECRIDAIAQAWSVLSGVATPERAEQALDSADRQLVDEEAGLIRLLTPPFDETPKDPGYIKGYLPGVRENGGQYTHGVLWLVRAMAEAGRAERAATLFSLLNPVTGSADKASAAQYGVEPYVAVADVYSVPPHVGRGGWSWYTGSGSWLYRVALESILGFTLEPGHIRLAPVPPPSWDAYEIDYEADDGVVYAIRVVRTGAGGDVEEARLDGDPLEPGADGSVAIPLRPGQPGDRRSVVVKLGG